MLGTDLYKKIDNEKAVGSRESPHGFLMMRWGDGGVLNLIKKDINSFNYLDLLTQIFPFRSSQVGQGDGIIILLILRNG